MLTLFHKEFRQHAVFVPAMILLCLCFQVAYQQGDRLFGYTITNDMFFYIAVVVAALYAGAAAALAYSTEHAEGTFTFLRKLPISPLTVAVGKIGWVLCGTVAVIIGNLMLTFAWTFGNVDGRIGLAGGFGIIEALVWGIFWSTRCRNPVHALLATYLCVTAVLVLFGNIFQPLNHHVADAYIAILPHRIAVVLFVGFFAAWGVARWFRYESTKPHITRLFPEHGTLFGYPQGVHVPFVALIFQHLWHASLIYPLGIFCFILFSLGSLFLMLDGLSMEGELWWQFGVVACVAGIVVFWGNIFGHDQRGDSYRMLSRLGIHEGTVWWSRMTPAFFLYIPVIATFTAYIAVEDRWLQQNWRSPLPSPFSWDVNWEAISGSVPIILSAWLAPVAVGAYLSISLRSQMMAIALTLVGVFVPFFWMMLGDTLFGVSPMWTTVPILIALIVASRLRATYWLRETYTWRSRLMPLVPVFATLLIVLVALPFVRIYSVPHVSWQQIDAFFEQAHIDGIERNPEKRTALIRYIAKHNAVPPEYKEIYERMTSGIGFDPHTISYEEYLLLQYLALSEQHRTAPPSHNRSSHWVREDFIRFMPWESVRADRQLRLQLVATLVEMGHLERQGRAGEIHRWCERSQWTHAFFDIRTWTDIHTWTRMRQQRPVLEQFQLASHLPRTFAAINRWYIEHETLPESLTELVEAGYLASIPTHSSIRRAPMQYHVNAPPPQTPLVFGRDAHFRFHHFGIIEPPHGAPGRVSVHIVGAPGTTLTPEQERRHFHTFREHGGTYLQFNRWYWVIVKPE